ncbi:MAG TPA: histidine kinase [Gaiellaceae bacterium]|jgi:signal transduction histidine kinase|nr:histidine kinase [Gaiellaceae bacterium]
MHAALTFLARRRWAGVGLALLVEVVVLAVLALLSASDTLGVPGAVAAAIAGTVAVVFGVVDGVAVAAIGALVFAGLDGWHAGGIAAIVFWPPIVAAAGLFARRVDRHRNALRVLVAEQEDERRALALTLHDDSAQTLTGALMTLRAGLESGPEQAREQINETIKQLRRLAVDLSPKSLEDYGLSAALAHLADSEAVPFEPRWEGRLPAADERMLFRFAQTALRAVRERGAHAAALVLGSERGRVSVTVRAPGATPAGDLLPASLEERIRLLDGRVATRLEDEELVLTADVPLA